MDSAVVVDTDSLHRHHSNHYSLNSNNLEVPDTLLLLHYDDHDTADDTVEFQKRFFHHVKNGQYLDSDHTDFVVAVEA